MLILLLVPYAAGQPNITKPTSIKLNQLTMTFLRCFYIRGMQHVIAAAVTNLVHSNLYNYAAIAMLHMCKYKNTQKEPLKPVVRSCLTLNKS